MYPQQQYIQVQYPQQQQQQVLQQGMPPQQQNQQPQQQQSLQTVQQQTMVPGAMMVAPPPPMGYQNSICCMDLQTGTIAVAIVIVLICLIYIGLDGFVLNAIWQEWSVYKAYGYGYGSDTAYGILFTIFLIVLIIVIVQLILAITLLIGANSRNLAYCRCWLISAIVFEIINFLWSAWNSYSTPTSLIGLALLIFGWLGWLFRLYSIAVVAAFCKELRMYGGAQGVGGGVVGVGQVTSTSATYYNATDNNAVPAQQYQPQQNGYGSPAATPVAAGGYTTNQM